MVSGARCCRRRWLAAVFAERHPNLVASALLLAPAIDNHQRNFAATPREEWRMPPEYVSALQQLPAREGTLVGERGVTLSGG